jgi:hypothetical protein
VRTASIIMALLINRLFCTVKRSFTPKAICPDRDRPDDESIMLL